MKKSIFILSLLSIITICLTACGKPGTSFEETIDSISHSELSEKMAKAENYKQTFNISSNFSSVKDNIKANVNLSTSTRHNVKDSEWETKISIRIDASWDSDTWRESISIGGNAIIRYLPRGIYFKLNSLNIDGLDDTFDESSLNLSWINNQRFSFELTNEMMEKITAGLPEDIDINNLRNDENLDKLKDNLKKSIKNEGSLVYKGIYSEFSWYNARKFSINKEKVFESFIEYIKSLVPEEEMDEYTQSLEDMNINEIFENFPFKNFEWYLVITWKDNVQIVIENLDIKIDNDTKDDGISTNKVHGTFGKNKYELIVNSDWKDIFIFSAKLNKTRYNVVLKVNDSEILKWTITPQKSIWRYSVDFNLSIKFEDGEDKISIPLKGQWNWKEIAKFNIEKPEISKNLLEDIMWDIEDIDPESYQLLAQGMGNQNFVAPVVIGWILAASLAPRMQSAQNRARDVARKNDLSQIQTAIITSQQDKWTWPGINSGATKWIPTSIIERDLMHAWMVQVPTDPNYSNVNYWLWENYKDKSVKWDYLYLVTKRNWVNNGGFVLMAKTEVEWSSNRVVCKDKEWLKNGYINNNTDLAKVKLCRNLTKWDVCSSNWDECTYTSQDELRYTIMY